MRKTKSTAASKICIKKNRIFHITHMELVKNIAVGICLPDGIESADVASVKGDYIYYHYCCDSQNDTGWGCGYRTLQSLCSWVHLQKTSKSLCVKDVPSITEIQKSLVEIGDKPKTFLNSREWIGSVEVGMVLDYLYDVPCKIVHIQKGNDLKNYVSDLMVHFNIFGSPIMMGGDNDAASKGVFGIACGDTTDYLLIIDPHYVGPKPTQNTLIDNKMLLWRPVDSFMENSFYNLCLPQLKYIT